MGSPLAFSCMVIWQKDLVVMVAHSRNPSPLDPGVSFQHQLRVNILSSNLSLATTDFELSDDGSPQPRVFRLVGRLPNGYLNLTGKVVLYWPNRWVVGEGTWWSNGYFTWGRAFTEWTGEIVIGNVTIPVSAWGAGEYTRYGEEAPEGHATQGAGCGCWGRWSTTAVCNVTLGED